MKTSLPIIALLLLLAITSHAATNQVAKVTHRPAASDQLIPLYARDPVWCNLTNQIAVINAKAKTIDDQIRSTKEHRTLLVKANKDTSQIDNENRRLSTQWSAMTKQLPDLNLRKYEIEQRIKRQSGSAGGRL